MFRNFGFFELYLDIFGPNAHEYENITHTFQLLSDLSEPIPPTLLDATFNKLGSSVSIRFDSATDYGQSYREPGEENSGVLSQLPITWNCNLLLVFIYANLSICSWTSASELTLSFPSLRNGYIIDDDSHELKKVTLLEPGGTLSLLAERLQAECVVGTDCTQYQYSSSSYSCKYIKSGASSSLSRYFSSIGS